MVLFLPAALPQTRMCDFLPFATLPLSLKFGYQIFVLYGPFTLSLFVSQATSSTSC